MGEAWGQFSCPKIKTEVCVRDPNEHPEVLNVRPLNPCSELPNVFARDKRRLLTRELSPCLINFERMDVNDGEDQHSFF